MNDRDPIVDDELRVRSWKDYEVVEHAVLGGLFLDKLWRRNLESGAWEAKLIRFRVPRVDEIRAQRIIAREIAKKEGFDPEKDPIEFEDLDVACLLQITLREPTEPFEPLALDPRDVQRRLDKGQLKQAWKKLEYYRQLLDPMPSNITAEQMVAMSAVIVQERSIRPLAVFDSLSQVSYIITTAEAHVNLELAKFSPESSELSTPES